MTTYNQRVLSLVIWPKRFGYVVFEGPQMLLEYGLKKFPGGAYQVRIPFGPKMARLISDWRPDVIVLKTPKGRRLVQKIKALQELATLHEIPIRLVSNQEIKQAFATEQNKYERAHTIAKTFSELVRRLPPRRKCYQSERQQMAMFDAAVVGITYFRQNEASPPRLQPTA